jgi:hypothetical protein
VQLTGHDYLRSPQVTAAGIAINAQLRADEQRLRAKEETPEPPKSSDEAS